MRIKMIKMGVRKGVIHFTNKIEKREPKTLLKKYAEFVPTVILA